MPTVTMLQAPFATLKGVLNFLWFPYFTSWVPFSWMKTLDLIISAAIEVVSSMGGRPEGPVGQGMTLAIPCLHHESPPPITSYWQPWTQGRKRSEDEFVEEEDDYDLTRRTVTLGLVDCAAFV